MSMGRRGFWTLRYTLLNVLYFAAFCTIHACAAVYLLAQGFTNTEVGILLAVANILSAIAQPLIAGVIDRPGALTNRRFILISVLVILAGSALLLFVHGKIAVFIIYVIIYMIQFAYQPVMTALCFEYQKKGCDIFYGLARGLGSAGFAFTSAFIGGAVERYGVTLLLFADIAVMAVSAVVIFFFREPATDMGADRPGTAAGICDNNTKDNTGASGQEAHNNLADFARTYPAFTLFLVGVVCFYFAHNVINDFMIQIIRNVGGDETELGYSNFLQGILELPVMALIGFVLKKIRPEKLLVFSGAAFFVKILILVFAKSMAGMYLSQSFQLFAYAVFIPAAAYYVSKTMEELDQVKGQAYVTCAITVGGVFSNLVSGVILDHLGIRPMLVTGSVVCFAGIIIAWIAMHKLPHNRTAA